MKRHSIAFLLAATLSASMAFASFEELETDTIAEHGEKVKIYEDRVYSIDEDTKKVYVSDSVSGKMQVFADAADCSSEKMALKDGYLYYYSYENDGIVRISLADKSRETIGTSGSEILEFIISEKNMYTIEKMEDIQAKESAICICSRDIEGKNRAVLLEGNFWNAKLRLTGGKLYFIDRNDFSAIHSYDIEMQKSSRISSIHADNFEIEDSSIYVMNEKGVYVMDLDGSNSRLITSEDFYRIEVEGESIYFIDGYEAYRYDCGDKTYKLLYKSDENYIDGIAASKSGAYLIETAEGRSNDLVDPYSGKLIHIEDEVDSAYVKDNVIYYENGRGLHSYDTGLSVSTLIDPKADSVWRVDDKHVYYSAYEAGRITGRRMDLESGEIKTLEGMKGYPVGLFADESGIYYFEYDVENYDGLIHEDECTGLVKLNHDGLDKKVISPWFISYDADMKAANEDYIFYDTRNGIFRVDKKNYSAKTFGDIGDLLGIADQTIYTYVGGGDSVYGFSTDLKKRREIVTGIGRKPFFNGRYFLLYDYEQRKIRMIDPQGSGERQADFDGEGVFFLESSNEDGIYFKSGGGLYFMDFTGLEIKKIADWDVRAGEGQNSLITVEKYSESKTIKRISQ